MEENTKLAHIKNLNKFGFNTTISIPIDSNVNIKTVLDVNTYLFDEKIECGNGKAVISGKIGVKVLYLDIDNMTNSICSSLNFSETLNDNTITNETYLNLTNIIISNSILSTEGNLKVNCDVTLTPIAYLNLSLSSSIAVDENLITKKRELTTSEISQFIKTQFEHTTNLETKDNVSKILCHNAYFTPETISAENDHAVVEGNITNYIVYEINSDDDKIIKELKETSRLKCDVEIDGLKKEHNLDISLAVDNSKDNISTDLDEDLNIITVKNTIKVCGVALKNIVIDVIDDVFSINNEIEATFVKRECFKNCDSHSVSEVILNEQSLNSDEPAIDEIISNLNQNTEITNYYIKDEMLYFEGVITSNLTYIDENKELKHKQLEMPFVINSKHQTTSLGGLHAEIHIVDCRVKVKRGIILEVEYTLFVNLKIHNKDSFEMMNNFSLGKVLDFSKYDYQIFIAKQGETMWELCKRIKISPDEILKQNKNLPLIMDGGEKIIIKR